MNIIAPSMLACDFGNLKSEIDMVNNSKADWFHIYVIDTLLESITSLSIVHHSRKELVAGRGHQSI